MCARRRTRLCILCSVKVINDCGDSRDHKETLSCVFCASICVHSADGYDSIDERREQQLRVHVGALACPHLETCSGEECSAIAHVTRPQRVVSGDSNISKFWLHDHNFYKTDAVCLSRSVRFLDSIEIW